MKLDQAFQYPDRDGENQRQSGRVKDLTLKGDQVRFVIDGPYEEKIVPMVFEGKA